MTADEFATRFELSERSRAACEAYAALLTRWSRAINLVARSTLPDLWSRHFSDSAQLLALAPSGARHWIDLGSGAGFPGLVVAILARETRPGLRVALIESDRRKATFLMEAARETGCEVEVLCRRVEEAEGTADVISARAFAPLPQLLGHAEQFCRPDTVLLLPKGENVDDELTAARRDWHIDVSKHASIVDPAGTILRITDLSRRDTA